MSESSIFATAVNVFASPSEAFPVVRERPRAVFPWLAIIAGMAAVAILFMNAVDLDWYMERQIRGGPAADDMTEEQIRQAVETSAAIPPLVLGAIGAVSNAVVLTLVFFLHALYLTGASFVRNDGLRLKQWFGLVCWCTLPSLLGVLASVANLVANDATFMPQERVNPLSFGNLLSLEASGGSVAEVILLSLDVTSIWALALIALGYQAWTGKALASSAAIALAPYVILVALGLYLAVG